jgi:hypothetical protein
MPRLLFDLAGGKNIFDDIKDSYVNVSWDTVIDRDPEWIVVSNPRISHDDIMNYLTTSPALKNVSAIKNRHILFMTYAERSPSPRNVDALERLAKTIHPRYLTNRRDAGCIVASGDPGERQALPPAAANAARNRNRFDDRRDWCWRRGDRAIDGDSDHPRDLVAW